MADLLVLDVYRDAQNELVRRAMREIHTFLSGYDTRDGHVLRMALDVILPDLVSQYGEAVATIAADRYDILREFSEVPGLYRATPAPPVDAERVLERARWATSPVWRGDAEQALSNVELMVDQYIKQPGRDTIANAAANDPSEARWARVPSGTDTCAFCLMLASRGAVYWTRETALYKQNGGKYHGGCNCEPTPVWGNDYSTLPADYDRDALYLQFADSTTEVEDRNDLPAILSAMRKNAGLR